MGFINTGFLLWLPLALLPLLLSNLYTARMNKVIFPSNELIKSILEKQIMSIRMKSNLRLLMRALAIFLIILAFSNPFVGQTQDRNTYQVVIDNTASMEVYPLENILARLHSIWKIDRVYFGNSIYTGEGVKFTTGTPTIQDILTKISSTHNVSNVILVTDGQASAYSEKVRLPESIRKIILCHTESNIQNISVESVTVFPAIARDKQNSDFTLKVQGEIKTGDRFQMLLNDKVIFSDRLSSINKITHYFSGQELVNGVNRLEVILEGDEFTQDNHFYMPLIASEKPKIYDSTQSHLIRKILTSIYGEYETTSDAGQSDYIITRDQYFKNSRQPQLLFTEKPESAGSILRNSFQTLPEFKNELVQGSIHSPAYPILEKLSETALTVNWTLHSPYYSLQPVVWVKDKPIIYKKDNTLFANFSLAENAAVLEKSPLLVFIMHEFFQQSLKDRYLLTGTLPKSLKFYHNSIPVDNPQDFAGLYQEKSSGKYLAVNFGIESKLSYLPADALRAKFELKKDQTLRIVNEKTLTVGSGRLYELGWLLFIIALALIMLELLL